MWINQPRSQEPDSMLTLSVYAFLAVLIKFLGNGVSFGDISLGTVDAALIGALLAPTLGAYVTRKWRSPPPDRKGE